MLNEIRHALRVRLMRAVEEATRNVVHEAEGRLVRTVEEMTRTVVQEANLRTRHDLLAAADRDAVLSSARFSIETMPNALTFPSPRATLEHALGLAPAGGMALEFGVFSGQTLKVIADARGGTDVYGFDSFKGLPEAWRSGFPAGAFGVDAVPEVPGAELVVGWFDETLPRFLAEKPEPVAFLHVDADIYSSTRTVLDHVGPRLQAGSVVVFDEYFNYPGWQQHEHRAWQEYVGRTGTRFHYESYTSDNQQVVICITDVP